MKTPLENNEDEVSDIVLQIGEYMLQVYSIKADRNKIQRSPPGNMNKSDSQYPQLDFYDDGWGIQICPN